MWGTLAAVALVAGACSTSQGSSSRSADPAPAPATSAPDTIPRITTWVYQLQDYPHGRLDALERAPHQLAVIDLARDGGTEFFRPQEIGALRASGKTVLAYFEIGSIEDFRPEYGPLRRGAEDLILNRWDEWPEEHFVRYWDPRWWELVVKPRIDRALEADFDGAYLDTPLAYEEVELARVPGQSRESLARAMVELIVRTSEYAKSRRPGFLVVPQNSPELRVYAGYTDAIDGLGMEELFFQATDRPCTEDFCTENLEHARAVRDAGKFVLAVDYATDAGNIRAACARYRDEGFAGYVSVPELDRIASPCPEPEGA